MNKIVLLQNTDDLDLEFLDKIYLSGLEELNQEKIYIDEILLMQKTDNEYTERP